MEQLSQAASSKRLPALSAFLLSVTSMELCLIASYRSKGLPPTPGTGRNWNGVVAAGREASAAPSHTARFYGLRFGHFTHPGEEMFSDYSSAASSLPFKGRQMIS